MNWTNKLVHSCARWSISSVKDDYGQRSYNENDIIVCRWMYKNEKITTDVGDEIISNAVIYTLTEVFDEDYFEFDDSIVGNSSPKTRVKAFKAKKIERHYDLKANTTLYKVYL